MTNPLRLLLLLLMGGSLLAARWTDALGQRLPAAARLPHARPQPVVQAHPFWLPADGWTDLAQPVDQPGRVGQAPAVRSL